MSERIHPTAIIDKNAEISDNVKVGPYCTIGPNVKIGSGTELKSHCNIQGHTQIGKNNSIFPFCSLGTPPQDHDYDQEMISYLKIGDNNIFREGFTANLGTKENSETKIGSNCFFMINSHVAHNCIIHDRVIMVNGSLAAGYVELGEACIVSGNAAIHQFCKVGTMAVISGGSAISKDLPPFMITSGHNAPVQSFNIIGMKRNGYSKEEIKNVKNIHRIFFRSNLSIKQARHVAEKELSGSAALKVFLDFLEKSNRGILTGRKIKDEKTRNIK